MNNYTKGLEFSKKMYIANIIIVSLITIISFIIIIFSGRWSIADLSPITVINTVSWAELATHTGFFVTKSKCENVIKIAQTIKNENIELADLKVANAISNGNEIDCDIAIDNEGS